MTSSNSLEAPQEALVISYTEGVTELTRKAVAAVREAVETAKAVPGQPVDQPPAPVRLALAELAFARSVFPVRMLAVAMEESMRQFGEVRRVAVGAADAALATGEQITETT